MENCTECKLRPQISITTLKEFELFLDAYQDAVMETAFNSCEDEYKFEEETYTQVLFELVKQKLNVTN